MYATLTAAALAFAAAQPPDTGRPGQPGSTPGIGQPGAPGGAAGAPMIDGTWTIVVLEKNGRPVTDAAKNMTVSIRGNVATFNKTASAGAGGTTGVQPAGGTGGTAGAAGSSDMRALRLDFGPSGTIRVMEAGADGKFGAGATGTSGTTGKPGTPGSSPGLGAQSGVRTGVYVLTQDYLAVCVHDTGAGAGTPGPGTTGTDRERPGSDRPGAGADRPGAGTNAQPGAGAQPGSGTSGVGDGRLPAQQSYVTVILRRDTGSRPGGAGTGTPGAGR